MDALSQYIVPYVFSNVIFMLTIFLAWKRPMWARYFFALSFLSASGLNATMALIDPKVYLTYGSIALLPFYQLFIDGFFSKHISEIVLPIAIGQFLIFMGLILNKSWTRVACIGGILFGLGIAPLGVGSAFPATVSMSVAFFILLLKQEHDFIWKTRQYKNK